jgi:hypothetical protein
MDANIVRGEAQAVVGSYLVTFLFTMDGLARLSSALSYPTFGELYARLVGSELVSTQAAVRIMASKVTLADGSPVVDERGKELSRDAAAKQVVKEMGLTDLAALQSAFISCFAVMTKSKIDDEGTEKN